MSLWNYIFGSTSEQKPNEELKRAHEASSTLRASLDGSEEDWIVVDDADVDSVSSSDNIIAFVPTLDVRDPSIESLIDFQDDQDGTSVHAVIVDEAQLENQINQQIVILQRRDLENALGLAPQYKVTKNVIVTKSHVNKEKRRKDKMIKQPIKAINNPSLKDWSYSRNKVGQSKRVNPKKIR